MVTREEFKRLLFQYQGTTFDFAEAHLGDQIGYAEALDRMNSSRSQLLAVFDELQRQPEGKHDHA